MTSILGLRASIRPSQDPAAVPCLTALRTTELAPMIRSRRSVRSPIFEVVPSFCLPPVECCEGVSPTQAAKSRPFLNAPSVNSWRGSLRLDVNSKTYQPVLNTLLRSSMRRQSFDGKATRQSR